MKNIVITVYVLITFVFGTEIQSTYPPTLKINEATTHKIAKAYRIAIGDITGNIQNHKSGVLATEQPCILAGLVYDKPWTRDAAINVWNGGGLLFPDAAKNTLLAQVGKDEEGNEIIIGQYWDKIIWSIGTWQYYLYNHDVKFLKYSYPIVKHTMSILEKDEFDIKLNLFRGPAVYGDGVAAYPKIYTESEIDSHSGSWSGIYVWPNENPSKKVKTGFGMPMMALSTNCVYAETYNILSLMEKELNLNKDNLWQKKYNQMKYAINRNFWNDKNQRYDYFVDPFGGCDYQEGLGHAFALLFEISEPKQIKSIMENIVVEPVGIPSVYPAFPRHKKTSDSFGRHAGTVWPHVQGFWADACLTNNNTDGFLHEFNKLTEHANRDFQFVEIYHPKTGLPYGGLQEPHLAEQTEWFCAERQTWSATAYLRMILFNIIGMEFSPAGITFNPYLPKEIESLEFGDFNYCGTTINIKITGTGSRLSSIKINGKESDDIIVSKNSGEVFIEIKMKE